MADDVDVFYWDACIFYEILREDQPDPSKRAAVAAIIHYNKEKQNRICTSVITHVEVIPRKLPNDQELKYLGLFNSLFFYDIELDRNVISLSREIRNYYYKESEPPANHKMMGTGDALHLATAIIHNVTHFHTRDGKRKGGNVPLLGLPEASPNGKICGKYDLKIVSPETLDLFPEHPPKR